MGTSPVEGTGENIPPVIGRINVLLWMHRRYTDAARSPAVAEAELAARGIHPVTIIHGRPATDAETELIKRLPELADDHHGPFVSSAAEHTTVFFDGYAATSAGGEADAETFTEAVRRVAPAHWRITPTITTPSAGDTTAP
jgi:hypothetical protein